MSSTVCVPIPNKYQIFHSSLLLHIHIIRSDLLLCYPNIVRATHYFACRQLIFCSHTRSRFAMILFYSIRKFYTRIGVCPSESSGNILMDLKSAFFLFSTIPITISLAAYFLFEASTTIEHTQSFFIFLFHLSCILNYVISFTKFSEIFEFMENVEDFVQKSKFIDVNGAVEG